MPPNAPMVVGKKALRSSYEQLFSQFRHLVKIEFDEIEVSESWSFAQGHYEGKNIPVDGGEPVHIRGKYLEIHKRQ
jgi:ketosteroid isomerase-like protein